MKIFVVFTVIIASFFIHNPVAATDRLIMSRESVVLPDTAPPTKNANTDTLIMMGPTGSGALFIGDFEAGWNGWTSVDETVQTDHHWQVSDYNQSIAGNLAAWCGDLALASCGGTDVAGGYGNHWRQILAFRREVADPTVAVTVHLTATLQYDCEPGYDFVYLSQQTDGSFDFTDIADWNYQGVAAVDHEITFLPSELINGTQVAIFWRFVSDGGWSDGDCSWPTAGALQVDDITVTLSQSDQPELISFTDFQDGTFGDWSPELATAAGDFAGLWRLLRSADPCLANFSRQVAFIDDGLVVPGTGGSSCLNWCYGPEGHTVNISGGLAGIEDGIDNSIVSPVMSRLDEAHTGLVLSYDVYRHELLTPDSPGIFYYWGVRSADTDGSAGNGVQVISEQPFESQNFIYYGGPGYIRDTRYLDNVLNPGWDEVQVKLSVHDHTSFDGVADANPAPYFDNVSVKALSYTGPSMHAWDPNLAQDNFPEVDVIDFNDLGSLHVRFDAAMNVAFQVELNNTPGDSILISIMPNRAEGYRIESPTVHYVIEANPVFDPYRTGPTSGVLPMRFNTCPTCNCAGPDDYYVFDLPDTGVFYPGDVMHYYFEAAEARDGDVEWAIIPADISGFGDFSDPLAYNRSYVVHALPTISWNPESQQYITPKILFWNDFGSRGEEDEWYSTFAGLGLVRGVDYDIYYTTSPTSGWGNGLGGRTAGPALDNYSTIIYTSGDLSFYTISNGDFTGDPSDDINTLLYWLDGGERNLFLAGDNLATDLGVNAGAAGLDFLNGVMGLNLDVSIVREMIQNQVSPQVLVSPGNPVFSSVTDWMAYGGCQPMSSFDGVTLRPGAIQLAEFAGPNGNGGVFPYSAATLNVYQETNRIISFPYGFGTVYNSTASKTAAPLPTRTQVLAEILQFFDLSLPLEASGVVPTQVFSMSHFPNPFNPTTRISYTVERPGNLTLRIYDLRGLLVRTLLAEQVHTDGFVMWDGTNDHGAAVASGVYFSEARMGGVVLVEKMALIK